MTNPLPYSMSVTISFTREPESLPALASYLCHPLKTGILLLFSVFFSLTTARTVWICPSAYLQRSLSMTCAWESMMPSSLLSSITPCCLLLAFTKVPAALPGPMSTVYYQAFLRYVLFALWGPCCGTYFWCSLTLIISLYFSYLTGDPILKAFLGLPGLWVLEFHWAGLSQPQPVSSHYLQSLYVISWATLSYSGPIPQYTKPSSIPQDESYHVQTHPLCSS